MQLNDDDFLKGIRNLNTNKAYDHDDITIWIIKLYDSSILKPLSIICEYCVCVCEFPNILKKSDSVYVVFWIQNILNLISSIYLEIHKDGHYI